MRYLRLYRAFVVNNLSRAMEFRAQFVAGIVGYLIWTAVSLIFISVVFGSVGVVRSWTLDAMWVLYGTYVIIESLCYGLLGPNMFRFPGTVRDGSLDLTLTRPVDVQFLVSSRYLDLNACLNTVPGLALILVGLSRAGAWPSAGAWLLWSWLLLCGFAMAYAIWFVFVTLAVWAVKLDAIAVAFDPLMQVARFPVQVYPQKLLFLLTFGIPVAFLTTFPAQALLGRAPLRLALEAPLMASALLLFSHFFFGYALRFYGSASS